MLHVNSSKSDDTSVTDKAFRFMRINAEKSFQWCKGVAQESYSVTRLYCQELKINAERSFKDSKGAIRAGFASMNLHSQDIRVKVVKAVKEGAKRTEVAHMFEISVSAVKWYLRQCKEQSHILLSAQP